MDSLAGKVAVVIGGTGGIGGAVARRFAAETAEVVATGRQVANGSVPAEQVDGTVHPLRADAGRPADLEQVFSILRSARGRVDILVVNAGFSKFAPLGAITADHFDRTFGLNVRSLLLATQGAVALMPAGGTVVLIGSIAGGIGTKGYGAYGASKAAVRAFARTWPNELAERSIRVSGVSPGPTDTAMFDAVTGAVRDSLIALIPLGRFGHPDEVASAALFRASGESSFITGAELSVDRGMAHV